MAKQISDEEWEYLQSRKQTADFVESIYNDPALADEAKALIKKKYPKLPIPEYDLRHEVRSTFAAEKKQRDDAEAEQRKRRQNANWQKKRAETQAKYGFTDDGMKDLEKMMVERNIGDYDAAATFKAARDPKPIDAEFTSQRWEHDKKPGWAEMTKDPEAWGRKEIMGAIQRDQQRLKNQQY
jgi:hypothetical protein